MEQLYVAFFAGFLLGAVFAGLCLRRIYFNLLMEAARDVCPPCRRKLGVKDPCGLYKNCSLEDGHDGACVIVRREF